jgi:hypothetical protein
MIAPVFEPTSYHCCAEWHLAQLRCPTAALVYPFALRISKNSGKFACSAISVAHFFGVHRTTVLRAYHQLCKIGFFQLVEYGKFDTNIYSVVQHRAWAGSHPGGCPEKTNFPWAGEGDPLAQKLYGASGGRVRFKAFQIAEYRTMGLEEREIVKRFDEFQGRVGKYRQPRNVGFHFMQYLRQTCQESAQP